MLKQLNLLLKLLNLLLKLLIVVGYFVLSESSSFVESVVIEVVESVVGAVELCC